MLHLDYSLSNSYHARVEDSIIASEAGQSGKSFAQNFDRQLSMTQ